MTAVGDRMRAGAFGSAPFRRLWTAGLVSDSGDWLLFVALPLVVLQLSGSAFGTALAFLLELIPAVLVAPVAARLVGRVDPRVLLASINAGQAVALVPLLLVRGPEQLPILYAVIAVEAALGALYDPAKNAVLPDLVDASRLVSANGLIGVSQNLARLVGGPLGGVLLALGGLPLVAVVDLVTYVVTGILVLTLPRIPTPDGEADPGSAGAVRGLGGALRDRRFRGVLVTTALSSAAQGMFLVLFVLFVTGALRGGEPEVGLLRGIQAIGAVAAGLAVGLLVRFGTRTLMAGGAAVFGVVSLVSWNLPAVTTALPPYVVLFIAVGAPGVVMGAAIVSSLQRLSSPAERGPVFAALGLSMAVGQGAGLLVAGLLQPLTGTLVLLEVQGGIYLATGLLALLVWPREPEGDPEVAGTPAGAT